MDVALCVWVVAVAYLRRQLFDLRERRAALRNFPGTCAPSGPMEEAMALRFEAHLAELAAREAEREARLATPRDDASLTTLVNTGFGRIHAGDIVGFRTPTKAETQWRR